MIFTVSILFFFVIIAMITLRMMRHTPSNDAAGDTDVTVYKDQMHSLTQDLQSGVITEGEFDSLRAEIGRRLIAAAKPAPQMPSAVQAGPRWAIILIIFAAGIAALAIYYANGAPNAPDMGLQGRIEQSNKLILNLQTQAEAEENAPTAQLGNAEDRALVAMLRDKLQSRPNDHAGYALLVRAESNLGNYSAARAAQQFLVNIKGDDATAEDWYFLAELGIIAANGYISREGEEALRRALQKDQNHAETRFRIGQLYLQVGRPDLTFDIWARLLEEGPESAPYIAVIRNQIDDLAYFAGQFRYTQPEAQGPSTADIAAAENLSEAERADMINAMVAGLSARLATSGGPAADWAKLINAYAVLGQTVQAQEIYQEAQKVFAGRDADLELLAQAARNGGLTE